MTTQSNHIIITLMLRNKSFSTIRQQYKINYNCVACLLACYLFVTYKKKDFTINDIVLLSGMFSNKNLKYYFGRLLNCDLISLAGKRHYNLTDKGYSAIQQINDNYQLALFNFCQKHNVVL